MSDEEMLDDETPENDSPEQDLPEVDEQPEVTDEAPEQEIEAPAAPRSPFDAFKSLPDFQGADERTIAQRLYQSLEREKQATHALSQYQQLMPVAQEYLANRPEYDKWRAAQQAPAQPVAQPPQKQEDSWWNPPQLRDAYKRYIVKDEHGRDTIATDAPLDARHAITEFFQYKQAFAEKFLSNPEEALSPMVTRLAQQQAEQIVRGQMEEQARTQYVASIEQENRDWLYDTNGNVSPEGAAARTYIEQAASLGIASPQARWDYALKMVERDLQTQVLAAQTRTQSQQAFQQQLDQFAPASVVPTAPPRQTQAEANMDYLRRAASRTANRAGVTTNSPEAARKGMSYAEQLRSQLSDDGLI
jgi:hypothetical protein